LNINRTKKLTTFVRAIKNCFTGHMQPAARGLLTTVLMAVASFVVIKSYKKNHSFINLYLGFDGSHRIGRALYKLISVIHWSSEKSIIYKLIFNYPSINLQINVTLKNSWLLNPQMQVNTSESVVTVRMTFTLSKWYKWPFVRVRRTVYT
jgi:hypothetical protein